MMPSRRQIKRFDVRGELRQNRTELCRVRCSLHQRRLMRQDFAGVAKIVVVADPLQDEIEAV